MIRKANSCLFGVAAITLLTGVVGCAPSEPTQIVAGMVTQMRVPEEIRSVGLVVQSDGKQVFCDNYQVDDETRTVTLPSTFAASSQGDTTKPLTVTVLGFPQNDPTFEADCYIERTVASGASAPQIMRRRRSTFVLNEMLYMPMPLRHSCEGVQCDDKNETCVAGTCQRQVDVDPQTLTRFDEELVYGRAVTCFNLSKCADPESEFTMPAVLTDRKTCEFELRISEDMMKALPKDAGLNVSIVHDNFTWEVLDYDKHEGFFLPSDGDGLTRFRLAEGLCNQRLAEGKVADVMVHLGCPSKAALQPICENDQKDIMGGMAGPLAVKAQKPLVVPSKLEPLDSAVFILLDDESMRSDLRNWSSESSNESKELPSWVTSLFTALDNPLMHNLRIGIAVSSGGENPFERSDFHAVYDKSTRSIEGFIQWLKEQAKSWPQGGGELIESGWFDGGKLISSLKDSFYGNNTIVLITDRLSSKQICPEKGTCVGDATMNAFCSSATKEAGSNVYVVQTKASWAINCQNVISVDGASGAAKELATVVSGAVTCKYKKSDALEADSVISYLYPSGGRIQIAPCIADDGNCKDGWKLVASAVEGGPSYIELQEDACLGVRNAIFGKFTFANLAEGLVSEIPLYISSK